MGADNPDDDPFPGGHDRAEGAEHGDGGEDFFHQTCPELIAAKCEDARIYALAYGYLPGSLVMSFQSST